MTLGLVGQKCGMTQIFSETGEAIPVSVILVEPNRIAQVKTKQNDGYSAVQVTVGSIHQKHLSKAEAGHFAKAGVEAGRGLWEFRVSDDSADLNIGSELTVDLFKEGQLVDVVATSKGKGFAGVIKRYHFATQDATHGNSLSHRAPGSIGQRQSPGRVFKGKKMAGHLGNKQITIQSQRVVKIDTSRNLILINGTIPGPINADVLIYPAARIRAKD